MDWRNDADYAFCDQLDPAGWAWQFLRRDPAYRTDYAEFISIWHQLEAAYGTPPNRDFFRWKQDPRAWRSEAEITGCGSEICPGENDQILIECWMGAKWGFRQFPHDPAVMQPETLAWREVPVEVEALSSANRESAQTASKLALIFDLALPLPAQLEAAKHMLVATSSLRAKAGQLPPRNTREGAPIWRRWLRLLDALDAGATMPDIACKLALTTPENDIAAAMAMRAGGYRRMLALRR